MIEIDRTFGLKGLGIVLQSTFFKIEIVEIKYP
jgi:hypothetical protein